MTSIDEDRLNVAIRKFLKVVGITSQREIEKAVREAVDSGTLPDSEKLAGLGKAAGQDDAYRPRTGAGARHRPRDRHG
jgi:hypothetical protein